MAEKEGTSSHEDIGTKRGGYSGSEPAYIPVPPSGPAPDAQSDTASETPGWTGKEVSSR
jgi:hypothetical protein